MASPAGLSRAVALRYRPLHDGTDPLPDAARRLALLVPNGQQHGHHVRCGDSRHAQPAQGREHMSAQARAPYRRRPGAVFPGRFVQRDHLLDGFGEGRDTRPPRIASLLYGAHVLRVPSCGLPTTRRPETGPGRC